MAELSLYERLGGVFAIAAVIDQFSDAVVGTRSWARVENPALREWHTGTGQTAGPEVHAHPVGLRCFGRTFDFSATKPGHDPGLEEAHRELRISPEEFDEVAADSAVRSTSSRCPSVRRARSWLRLPPTRAR